MKKKLSVLSILGITFLTLLACVTINVYFPEAAIKDLSQQIEEEVEKQAAPSEKPSPVEERAGENTPNSPSSGILDTLLGVTAAHAAEDVPEPGISNPAIRKIIEARRARLPEINRFKGMGAIGENNGALLEIRALDVLADLRDRAAVQRLVNAENADRERLFKEIAAAEGVDLSQLPRIRETYAETMRSRARPGDWIQMPDGNWRRK